jgi:hypothetical protein
MHALAIAGICTHTHVDTFYLVELGSTWCRSDSVQGHTELPIYYASEARCQYLVMPAP